MVKRMPKDWNPPYPGWSGKFASQDSPLVFAYFACQFYGDEDRSRSFRRWWAGASAAPNGPGHFEMSNFLDSQAANNVVAVAYWRGLECYQRWWEAVAPWWDGQDDDGVGYWREIHVVKPTHFETAFATTNADGVGHLADGFGEPVLEHAYWGAMRDRIPASETDPLNPGFEGPLQPLSAPALTRVRLRVPENLVMIRSAQDWRGCGEIERNYYLDRVHPVMVQGMKFLQDHPIETGCISCRVLTYEDSTGTPEERTFATAHFISLAHLERWAESHPSHVAIFETFLQMVKDFDYAIDLRLWHEVVLLDGASCVFEYDKCHASTGSMRFLPSIELER